MRKIAPTPIVRRLPWGLLPRLAVSTVALGAWIAGELGVLMAYAPEGAFGTRWKWMIVSEFSGRNSWVLISGFLLTCGMLMVAWTRCRLGGSGLNRNLASRVLGPGLILGLADAGCLTAQLHQDGRTAVYAQMVFLLSGRLCVGAMLWEAADLGGLFRALVRAPGRAPRAALAVLAVAPVIFLRGISATPTGDEPSYTFYATSLVRDGDFQFNDKERIKFNREMGFPLEQLPHYPPLFGGRQVPGHFLGTTFMILPAVAIGNLCHAILPSIRIAMLIFDGITLLLCGLLAMKLTRLPGPSIMAAAIVGISFPLLGMSYQAYPDPFVAMLVAAAMVLMADSMAARTTLPLRNALWVLFICGLFPWFHTKYASLSVAFGICAFLFQWPWRIRNLALSATVVAGTAAIFFLVHLPMFGEFMWKQSAMYAKVSYGATGFLTDSHFGVISYLPWVVVVPVGFCMGWRRIGGWRYFLSALLVVLAVVGPSAAFVWEGGATALRYFTPVIPIMAPLLAIALAGLGRRALFVAAATLMVPLLTCMVFLNDPWSAYTPYVQGLRVILDKILVPISWREFFAPMQFYRLGTESAMGQYQGTVILIVTIAVSLVLCLRRVKNWFPLAAMVMSLFALAGAARVYESPNWGISATRFFLSQVQQFARVEERRPRRVKKLFPRQDDGTTSPALARLALPAKVKPVEREFYNTDFSRVGVRVPLMHGDGYFFHGPELLLPHSNYRLQILGSINPLDNGETSTGTIELVVHGLTKERQLVYRKVVPATDLPAPDPNGKTQVLLECTFAHKPSAATMDYSIHRIGNVDFNYERYQLDYLGGAPQEN
ncbi:MAG: hypothetical protein K1X53_12980 [Candidatus Sumerlaeaceae bacterium]|nr:hypothetical protein [Candidatus Sumerlaeaceae bacterium]